MPSGGVEGLIHEHALSSQEGVALMCLAEALRRIPDDETRDALIRDKIGAVVGVQPFGGHGLSGTGPKAGGPLYVHRLLSRGPVPEVRQGELAGPVGERNSHALRPRGAILCVAADPAELQAQQVLVRESGNRVAASEAEDLAARSRRLAERPGRIVPVHVAPYPRHLLLDEVALSRNTAAAGGNASLMAIS